MNTTKVLDLLTSNRTAHELSVKHDVEDRKELFKNILNEVFNKFDATDAAMIGFIGNLCDKYPEFFTSPASVKYHGAYEGGLFDHSMAVYEAALRLAPVMGYDPAKVNFIACVFHDLCKVGAYKRDDKFEQDVLKKADGSYVNDSKTIKKYTYTNNPGISHGAESLRRLLNCCVEVSNNVPAGVSISKCILPSEAWQFAIAQHMGAFCMNDEDTINFGNNCEKYPEVLLLHTADMVASKIYGL